MAKKGFAHLQVCEHLILKQNNIIDCVAASKLLITDGPHFADVNNLPVNFDDFKLPDDTWYWDGNWIIDCKNPQCDEEGWKVV